LGYFVGRIGINGGDNSDVELLDQVLHADFRVTNNGYMGAAGLTVFDKKAYLDKDPQW
jgi:hypothetical protein